MSLRKIALRVSGTAAATLVAIATTAALTAAPAVAATGFSQISGESGSKCLDIRTQDGPTTPFARAQYWTCSGATEQQWQIQSIAQSGGEFLHQIVNKRSGMCLEVRNSSLDNGAQVDQYPCAFVPNQLWRAVTPGGTSHNQFINLQSGKCLDRAGGSSVNGTKIQQYDCNGTTAQGWFWG